MVREEGKSFKSSVVDVGWKGKRMKSYGGGGEVEEKEKIVRW